MQESKTVAATKISLSGEELAADRMSIAMETPAYVKTARRLSLMSVKVSEDVLETMHMSTSSAAREALKLAVVIFFPLVGVIALASLNLSRASSSLRSANAMTNNLEVAEAIRRLVTMLQRERGMTCVLLNSVGYVV